MWKEVMQARAREKEESNFPWEYDVQETCLILEGKAVVHTKEGNIEFGEGDYVAFPKGLACKWEIKKKSENTTTSAKGHQST